MDELAFWKQKVCQFFHDPPAKPYTWYPGTGGHANVAKELFERFASVPLKYYAKPPDWAASGADRPLLTLPRGKGSVQLRWPNYPYVTHPLAQGYVMDARHRVRDISELHAEVKPHERLLEEETTVAEELGKALEDWQDAKQLQQGFIRLWRRFRDELIARRTGPGRGNLIWEEMPADSRCPDHSIWDHLRVTTALAFMDKKLLPEAQEPWLFTFNIGPVQRFIRESRTSRDLWTSSYLLADLAWHAMQPLVEQYGPDCIVYPDLRTNPRVDCWLAEQEPEALPEYARNPSTFAAVLPSTFTALLPRGSGTGYLRPIEELAAAASNKVQERWNALAKTVLEWLQHVDGVRPGRWEQIWAKQHNNVIHTYWSAVAWQCPESIDVPESLRGRALPAQRPDFRPAPSAKDAEAIQSRKKRLAPWIPQEAWARYEWAREVYAFTNLKYHQMERGFDYVLTHHQLRVRHTLRKATAPDTLNLEEGGEKCTLCGRREALAADSNGKGGLDGSRTAARRFWQNPELDPDALGEERLCAVCTMKRFLVTAGQDRRAQRLTGLNPLWTGHKTPYEEVIDLDGEVRIPFPSMATVAAQDYLSRITTIAALQPYLAKVVAAYRAARLPRTSFPRALPRLAEAAAKVDPMCQEFLKIDAQDALFPDALRARRKREEKKNPTKASSLKDLEMAVRDLRRAADKPYPILEPELRLSS